MQCIKMKGEIPVCTRCCFCLPLRYGLITWGYFKLIADLFLMLVMCYITLFMILMFRAYKNDFWALLSSDVIIGFIGLLLCLTDFVVTIVFIVGGHKKNVKLMRVFYIYSMVLWVISAILSALTVIASIESWLFIATPRYFGVIVINVVACLGILIVQSYFVLLLRSEIIKLRSNCEFRFVNNAAEAECTMTCGDEEARDETDVTHVLESEGESKEEIERIDQPV